MAYEDLKDKTALVTGSGKEQGSVLGRVFLLAGETEQIYARNLAFHGVFLELSDNTELKKLIKPRKERLYDFPRRAYLQEWELRNSKEHQQLIACIKNNDPQGAATVMRDVHWSFTYQEKFIRKFYSLSMEEYEAKLSNHLDRSIGHAPAARLLRMHRNA